MIMRASDTAAHSVNPSISRDICHLLPAGEQGQNHQPRRQHADHIELKGQHRQQQRHGQGG